jgi:hypothetical protein
MGGLIFIIPILAFDIWLFATTGRRQVRRWLELKQSPRLLAAFAAGLVLAVWLTFIAQYGSGLVLRKGFPIPLLFFRTEDKTWAHTDLPAWVLYTGLVTDFLTGFAIPFIPSKIAEFLRQVKAELK